ncbi:MAG: beta-propeller domain-containing protein [Candidatus Cohnella colombiensis]|uniref:Beta-propeller domain-containing protein n=1 Tax=Candidatus Cohnella colombiensis TaxID=3121368 RepID=A0AA95JC43_9BACL|nr:MAG: beta-propeller domain-containing protein [Cohnella sp.]
MNIRIGIVALITFILMAVPTVAAPAKQQASTPPQQYHIKINGTPLELSTAPYVVKHTTMVPLRQIAVALGAKVTFKKSNDGKQSATLTRQNRTAILTVGSIEMVANDRTIKLPIAPEMRSYVMMVPLRALSEALGTIVAWDATAKVIHINDPKTLPVIGTEKKLNELYSQFTQGGILYGKRPMAMAEDGATVQFTAESMAGAAESSKSEESKDFSETNVQVAGVDEADWAKTDGKFIYQISGQQLYITDIGNKASPKLAATLDYRSKGEFQPQEMYVDDHRLVVIGQTYSSKLATETVQTLIYTLDDAGKPTLQRETELEGRYISSRKIDSALYIVTNKYMNYWGPMIYEKRVAVPKLMDGAAINEVTASDPNADLVRNFEPVYRDSAHSPDPQKLPLSDIRYFPDSPDMSTMLIGALDLDRPDQEMQVSAYLGSGQAIYASSKHLYVAVAKYTQNGAEYKQLTQIYKFRLDQGQVVYAGEGSVPGQILNQFSMDEHNGYFRIATTDNKVMKDQYTSTNNIYVLDEQLQTIGTLEDLAPGEHIYSVRFMGGRAYMVTFRTVDPLFVIDLHTPTKPAVLGQLKIPGYSDYLHPYDDTHIIGFGKETVELPSKGLGPGETMAYYQGFKMAIFDVSDVNNPKEQFKEIIGDRGTSSELLTNHKALLFDRSKGLLAFPVDLMEVNRAASSVADDALAYGQFTYQGAYVYGIDLEKGFTLRGRITHLSNDDLAKSGQYGFDYRKAVRRILYAGDTLYTLSERMVKANALSNLSERGSLTYPVQ